MRQIVKTLERGADNLETRERKRERERVEGKSEGRQLKLFERGEEERRKLIV